MIKIYTIPNYSYCERVKEFLKNKEIKYIEIDVSKDKEKAKEMIIKSGQKNVSVLDIDEKIITRNEEDNEISLIKKLKSKFKN